MVKNKFRPHHPDEYQKLLDWAAGASSVLEVGSRYGFTLYDLAQVAKPGCRVVGVDLPGPDAQWGYEDSGDIFKSNVAKLGKQGFDAHCILGDSHSPEVIEHVKSLGPFDFVFIDANHRIEHVRQDWENFGPLGKRVVFHDIRKPGPGENQDCQVWMLWEVIKDEPDTESYLGQGTKMGIGRIGSF